MKNQDRKRHPQNRCRGSAT